MASVIDQFDVQAMTPGRQTEWQRQRAGKGAALGAERLYGGLPVEADADLCDVPSGAARRWRDRGLDAHAPVAAADGNGRVDGDSANGKGRLVQPEGFDADRAVGDIEQPVVVWLDAPSEPRIGVIADFHRSRRVNQVEDAQARVVIGPIQQPVANPRIVRAENGPLGRRVAAERVDDLRLPGVGDIDDVEALLPAAEFLVAVNVVALGPSAVDAFGEGERG